MSKSQQGLLTLGALIIIIAVTIILGAAFNIWYEVIPLIIAFYGCWLIIAAGIKTRNTSKYERSALSLFSWGMLLAAIGFGLDFAYRGLPLVYTLAVVLLLLGILAIVAALKTTQKKA